MIFKFEFKKKPTPADGMKEEREREKKKTQHTDTHVKQMRKKRLLRKKNRLNCAFCFEHFVFINHAK